VVGRVGSVGLGSVGVGLVGGRVEAAARRPRSGREPLAPLSAERGGPRGRAVERRREGRQGSKGQPPPQDQGHALGRSRLQLYLTSMQSSQETESPSRPASRLRIGWASFDVGEGHGRRSSLTGIRAPPVSFQRPPNNHLLRPRASRLRASGGSCHLRAAARRALAISPSPTTTTSRHTRRLLASSSTSP
jgi:hypothetical protein